MAQQDEASMAEGASAEPHNSHASVTGSDAGQPASSPQTVSMPYRPQFTAATSLILQRLRGEPGNLGAAISSVSSSVSVQQPTYDEVKQRVVRNMSTAFAIPMPMPIPMPTSSTVSMPMPTSSAIPAPNMPTTTKPRGPIIRLRTSSSKPGKTSESP